MKFSKTRFAHDQTKIKLLKVSGTGDGHCTGVQILCVKSNRNLREDGLGKISPHRAFLLSAAEFSHQFLDEESGSCYENLLCVLALFAPRLSRKPNIAHRT